MVIGIIAAMEIEMKLLKESLGNYQKNVIAGVKFYKAQVNENIVIVVHGGIGKVNIAHAASLLCNQFKPNVVINTGIAGGLSPLTTRDILIANQLSYHDVDATFFGYSMGQVPQMPKHFLTDPRFVADVCKILHDECFDYKKGSVITGDLFVTDRSDLKTIPNDEYVGVDMEGAAIAHICYLYQIPFVSIRFISDSIDSPNQHLDYPLFENEAAHESASICKKIMYSIH